jgi:energy-coupling factor transporter transmembrane protein EcfT
MSALFALTRLGTTWESAVVIVEKGAITSLALLLLVASTPAIELFQTVRRVMPRTLAEILFLGYRSIFLLVGRALAAREAVRLRSAQLPFPAQLKRNALVGALAVLRASELASEQYAAMRLRGLGADRVVTGPRWRWPADLAPLLAIVALLAVALLVSRLPDAESLVLVAALVPLLIVGSAVARWRTAS